MALHRYHGKVLDSNQAGELIRDITNEFMLKDVKKVLDIIKKREPVPFTGLYISPVEITAQTDSLTNQRVYEANVLDVFGYCYRTPMLVRITGWRPSFMVRLPVCVEYRAFKALFIANAAANKVDVGLIEMEECNDWRDFDGFEFGRKVKYLKVTTNSARAAKKAAKAALGTYEVIIERLEYGEGQFRHDGIGVPTTPYEKSQFKVDKKKYPLRFTRSLSLPKIGYQFMTEEDLPLVNHMWVRNYKMFNPCTVGAIATIGLEVKWEEIDGEMPLTERTVDGTEGDFFRNAVCVAYDLETYCADTAARKISDPRILEDGIIVIGLAIYRISDDIPVVTIGITLESHRPLPVEGGCTIVAKDEGNMLELFYYIMMQCNMSFFNGFNSDKFDNEYIKQRSHLYGGMLELLLQAFDSYYQHERLLLDTRWKRYSGTAPQKRIHPKFDREKDMRASFREPERIIRANSVTKSSIDTRSYMILKRPKEFQESSSLNAMLKYYNVVDPETKLSMSKLDMPYDEMFRLWRENSSDGISRIVHYCMVDAKASYVLLKWINYFPDVFEMAKLTYSTIPDVLHRRNSDKVIQTLTRYARKMKVAFNNVVPDDDRYKKEGMIGKIGGGDVRSLYPGLHTFVISLDYSAMYPSIKETMNVGLTARVDEDVIKHPERWGLSIIYSEVVRDQFCGVEVDEFNTRARYWIMREEDLGQFVMDMIRKYEDYSQWYRGNARYRAYKAMVWHYYYIGKVYRVEQLWAESKEGPKLYRWKTYYVQSRRRNGKLYDRYSVQCEFLSDFRRFRSRVRQEKKEAEEEVHQLTKQLETLVVEVDEVDSSNDLDAKLEEKRREIQNRIAKLKAMIVILDAKQLNAKIVSNSEFGITDNKVFPIFDRDTAPTTTWAARMLAGFLRRFLSSSEIVLPDYVLEKGDTFRLMYKELAKFGVSVSEKHHWLPDDAWKDDEGRAMIELHLMRERRKVDGWYIIKVPPVRLIYQDTDSNYYILRLIVEYYERLMGKDRHEILQCVKQTLHSLLDHNEFIALLLKETIHLPPISVSCDGGYITAYISPLKKQRLGTKMPIIRKKIDALDENVLWPVLSDFDVRKEAVSQYLDRKKISVTGYQIIKRDTPPYVIKYLLMLCEKILAFRSETDIVDTAHQIIKDCRESLNKAKYDDLFLFSDRGKYKPAIVNTIKRIIYRLRDIGKAHLTPDEHTVVRYILLADPDYTVEKAARGLRSNTKKANRYRLLTEMKEICESGEPFQMDEAYYIERLTRALANLIYQDVFKRAIAEKAISEEDYLSLKEECQELGEEAKKKRTVAYKTLIGKAAEILFRPYHPMPKGARVCQKEFRNAVEALNTQCPSFQLHRKSVKAAFMSMKSRNTPIRTLVEKLLGQEAALARRSRGEIEKLKWGYIRAIGKWKNPSHRIDVVNRINARVCDELKKTIAEVTLAYSTLLRVLNKVNPIYCARVLRSRQRNKGLSLTEITDIARIADQQVASCGETNFKNMKSLSAMISLSTMRYRNAVCDDLGFKAAINYLKLRPQ